MEYFPSLWLACHMIRWLSIFIPWFRSVFQTQGELALENLALRQQLAVMKFQQPRPKLSMGDRRFWLFLSRYWSDWRQTLIVVQPDTVVRWHRKGFKYYWTWKSRRNRGRPIIDREIRIFPENDHFRESFISHLNKFNNFRLIKIIYQSL